MSGSESANQRRASPATNTEMNTFPVAYEKNSANQQACCRGKGGDPLNVSKGQVERRRTGCWRQAQGRSTTWGCCSRGPSCAWTLQQGYSWSSEAPASIEPWILSPCGLHGKIDAQIPELRRRQQNDQLPGSTGGRSLIFLMDHPLIVITVVIDTTEEDLLLQPPHWGFWRRRSSRSSMIGQSMSGMRGCRPLSWWESNSIDVLSFRAPGLFQMKYMIIWDISFVQDKTFVQPKFDLSILTKWKQTRWMIICILE